MLAWAVSAVGTGRYDGGRHDDVPLRTKCTVEFLSIVVHPMAKRNGRVGPVAMWRAVVDRVWRARIRLASQGGTSKYESRYATSLPDVEFRRDGFGSKPKASWSGGTAKLFGYRRSGRKV